jgi:exosortase
MPDVVQESPPIPAEKRAADRMHAWFAAGAAVLVATALFQFFGNGSLGYIPTRSLFYWWGFQWFNPGSEAEHGPVILAVSVWLFWRNLRLGSGQADRAVPGLALAVLGAALALHLLGYAVQQARISIAALLLFVWGAALAAGGVRWGRAAAFPLVFLLFAVPVNFLDSIGFYLRVWVTDFAYALSQAAGFDVIRNGTQLLSGDGTYQYDVAAACSGIRSLTALAGLSLLVGYLFFRSWPARFGIFLLCAPYAIAGNVVRIFAIIAAAEWFGSEAGMRVHDASGALVFLTVLGLLLATVAAAGGRLATVPKAGSAFARTPGMSRSWAMGLAGGVVFLGLGAAGIIRQADAWQVRADPGVFLAANGLDPVELPERLGWDWVGRAIPVSAIELEILPEGTGFSRKVYVSRYSPPQQVFLSIVLSGNDRTSIHRPELCLVGQGWSITGRFGHRFERPDGEGDFPASILRIRREFTSGDGGRVTVPALYAYWFVGGDRVVATHSARMFRLAWDRLFRFRSDRWSYVVAQTDVMDGEEAALARLQEVLDHALPAFQKPFP